MHHVWLVKERRATVTDLITLLLSDLLARIKSYGRQIEAEMNNRDVAALLGFFSSDLKHYAQGECSNVFNYNGMWLTERRKQFKVAVLFFVRRQGAFYRGLCVSLYVFYDIRIRFTAIFSLNTSKLLTVVSLL